MPDTRFEHADLDGRSRPQSITPPQANAEVAGKDPAVRAVAALHRARMNGPMSTGASFLAEAVDFRRCALPWFGPAWFRSRSPTEETRNGMLSRAIRVLVMVDRTFNARTSPWPCQTGSIPLALDLRRRLTLASTFPDAMMSAGTFFFTRRLNSTTGWTGRLRTDMVKS